MVPSPLSGGGRGADAVLLLVLLRGRGGEDGRIAGGVESEKNAENDDGGVIRSCWSGG
jgi:hypothetical protein